MHKNSSWLADVDDSEGHNIWLLIPFTSFRKCIKILLSICLISGYKFLKWHILHRFFKLDITSHVSGNYYQTRLYLAVCELAKTLRIPAFPFADKCMNQIFHLQVDLKFPKVVSDGARDLISKLLRHNPIDRLPLQSVIDHQWVRANSHRLLPPTCPVKKSWACPMMGLFPSARDCGPIFFWFHCHGLQTAIILATLYMKRVQSIMSCMTKMNNKFWEPANAENLSLLLL